jgi:hypothetical protein
MLSLDKLSCLDVSGMELIVRGYCYNETLEVRVMTAIDNLTYGVSRFTLAVSKDKLQFGR